MVGLQFFPNEKSAQTELVKALEFASSPEIARTVVDDWLAQSTDRPTPADLRRMISDHNAKAIDRRGKCRDCGGAGCTTAWFLITYQGNSLRPRYSERLREIGNHEQANEFIGVMPRDLPNGDRRTVLSAAVRCGCSAAV